MIGYNKSHLFIRIWCDWPERVTCMPGGGEGESRKTKRKMKEKKEGGESRKEKRETKEKKEEG